MDLTKDEINRFKQKYTETNQEDCWEWQGAKYQNGYGMIALRRGKRKTFSAHRISWMIANNRDIPDGMMICHKCDNRLCVNPNHLYAGTGSDNNTDTLIRKRGNRKIGENCSWAKLTEADVFDILNSKEKQCKLAEKYHLDPSTVSQIKSGKRWKHLSRDKA